MTPNLSVPHVYLIHTAILKSCDRQALEKLLFVHMGTRLELVAKEDTLDAMALSVITWVARMERIPELIDALVAESPQNSFVQELARQYAPVDSIDTGTEYRIPTTGSAHPDGSVFSAESEEDISQPWVMVGRQRELELLREVAQRVENGGPQMVAIVGEGGMGKTRLARESQHLLMGKGYATAWMECNPAFAAAPFHVVSTWFVSSRRLWHRLLGLDEHSRSIIARLPRVREKLDVPPALSMVDHAQQVDLYAAMDKIFLSIEEPLALFIDNLHFCDLDSLQWLSYLLIHKAAHRSLLVVSTIRSERTNEHIQNTLLDLQARQMLKKIELPPLSEPELNKLALIVTEQKHRGSALPDSSAITNSLPRFGGNPYYVVEYVEHIASGGSIEQVPPSVSAYIQTTRLRDLKGKSRDVVDIAAIVGRPFRLNLLASASHCSDEELLGIIEDLEQRRVFTHDEVRGYYHFTHDLVRDIVVETMFKGKLSYIHRCIGEALEATYADNERDRVSAQIASHYAKSDHPHHAIPYFRRAGKHTLSYSVKRAAGHYESALKLLETLPATPEHVQAQREILLDLGFTRVITEGYAAQSVLESFQQALQLSTARLKSTDRFRVLVGLTSYNLVKGNLTEAYNAIQESLSFIGDDQTLRLEAEQMLGVILYYKGKFGQANMHLTRASEIYSSGHYTEHFRYFSQNPGVVCLSFSGMALWFLGDIDTAVDRCNQACELAQTIPHPYSQALALFTRTWVHQMRREWGSVHASAQELISVSKRNSFRFWWFLGHLFLKKARAELISGENRGSLYIKQVADACNAYQTTGSLLAVPFWLTTVAELYLKQELIDEGLSLLGLAQQLQEENGDMFYDAELCRVMGELHLRRHGETGVETAIEWYGKAIHTANSQEAKVLELRATTSLCRLLQKQGSRAVAFEKLKTIYEQFEEGFDTPDLQEASALLRVLSRPHSAQDD